MLDTKFVCTRGKVTEDRHGSGDNTNDIVRATRDRLHSRSHHVILYMTHFMCDHKRPMVLTKALSKSLALLLITF
jgi:hypothetical protein